eukprot:CAMPEP_0181351074 /NCGR_PEP_ID=MMETSP1106-20121128/1598_1 /TAXON_ID=81844 /ORGANISM="Mantoniella antarctica, Strain SL-175" /LENGTH=58 /DNA_ID=CAMNT_0023463575 /DNA_START=109 /DNA_END=285 /DNA_ORIENTATION=+
MPTNAKGNNYTNPGGSNTGSAAYHYSNTDGSYYYKNDNGSTYHCSPEGKGTYSPNKGK